MRNGCSDRLCHIHDKNASFEDIMELYCGQIFEELGVSDDDPFIQKCIDDMNKAANKAMEIYQQSPTNEAAAQAMQASGNSYVVEIGEALESGDWSLLAI